MPIISSQIYNNDGTQLLGTIENTDANVFYLKSDGVYRNDTLELAISNFVGLTQTINGTTPDSGYAVPTPSGNGVALDTSMGETIWYAIQGSSNIQIPITKNGKTTLATKGTENVEDIDINVDIPTYITVASESALPSTAQEGTIAVVEGVAMYSVSCSSYADKVDTALKTYYSTNNGSTWTEFDSTGVLTSQATQIKFRMTYPSGLSAPGKPKIVSGQLGMTLSHSFSNSGFDITSDNYTLTEDITDVTYNEDL